MPFESVEDREGLLGAGGRSFKEDFLKEEDMNQEEGSCLEAETQALESARTGCVTRYLGLRSFTFKVGITIVATLWGSCKDKMIIHHVSSS